MSPNLVQKESPPGSLSIVAFGLVAATILATQIILSRLFAGIMTYYFGFMLISLAMLGLGAGGLIVHLVPKFFRREKMAIQASVLSISMGVFAFIGTLVMLYSYKHLALSAGEINYSADDLEESFLMYGVMFWCFFPPFLAGGTVVSLVLRHARKKFHQVYAVDLAFAAGGCIVAMLLLASQTPVESMLSFISVLPLLAAIFFSFAEKRYRTSFVSIAISIGVLVAGSYLSQNIQITKPPNMRWLKKSVVLSEWGPLSSIHGYRTGFYSWALSPNFRGKIFPMINLMIDGAGGTQVVAFNGDVESLKKDYEYLDYDLTALSHELVGPTGKQLIIGPGGGVDILQAVKKGKTDITAVEINPLMVRIVNSDMAEFSGQPYRLPGVKTVIENGRTFIERANEKWDLIVSTWVDTGGSASSLAFSENYLYTIEAYRGYLQKLSSNGVVAFLRGMENEIYRVDSLRGISVAVEALSMEGAQNVGNHIAIVAVKSPFFSRAMCYTVIKKSPFTKPEVDVINSFAQEKGFHPIWLPNNRLDIGEVYEPFRAEAKIMHDIISSKDRIQLYERSTYDIEPSTDDNPFYFVERAGANRDAGRGVKSILSYLYILLVLVIPFLVFPMIPLIRKTNRIDSGDVMALFYFGLLGLAYILVEVEFFQVFSLLLGSPTISFATVLAALLVFSGIGSLSCKRLSEGPAWMILISFLLLVGTLWVFMLGKGAILEELIGLSLAARIIGTVLIIAPIGFLMGLPMATGMNIISEKADIMLWGWALNGFFSVLAGVISIYFSIHHGIQMTVFIGILAYLIAGILIQIFRKKYLSIGCSTDC